MPVEPLPLRLSRAMVIIAKSGDPGAPDAQSACGETAARIVMLEEALGAMLRKDEGAESKALLALATG